MIDTGTYMIVVSQSWALSSSKFLIPVDGFCQMTEWVIIMMGEMGDHGDHHERSSSVGSYMMHQPAHPCFRSGLERPFSPHVEVWREEQILLLTGNLNTWKQLKSLYWHTKIPYCCQNMLDPLNKAHRPSVLVILRCSSFLREKNAHTEKYLVAAFFFVMMMRSFATPLDIIACRVYET